MLDYFRNNVKINNIIVFLRAFGIITLLRLITQSVGKISKYAFAVSLSTNAPK